MVHDTLEYYRNDLHALPLKLQIQLYMHLTCKLIHLSLHRRASMQDRRPGGEQAVGNWRYTAWWRYMQYSCVSAEGIYFYICIWVYTRIQIHAEINTKLQGYWKLSLKILAFGKNETNTAYFGKQGVRGNARTAATSGKKGREIE